jgi:hypothetical protein
MLQPLAKHRHPHRDSSAACSGSTVGSVCEERGVKEQNGVRLTAVFMHGTSRQLQHWCCLLQR